jgi:hypothetical protein
VPLQQLPLAGVTQVVAGQLFQRIAGVDAVARHPVAEEAAVCAWALQARVRRMQAAALGHKVQDGESA